MKLEARSGWEAAETIKVGRIARRMVGLTVDEAGQKLSEDEDTSAGSPD